MAFEEGGIGGEGRSVNKRRGSGTTADPKQAQGAAADWVWFVREVLVFLVRERRGSNKVWY